jgi:hypothetical protein
MGKIGTLSDIQSPLDEKLYGITMEHLSKLAAYSIGPVKKAGGTNELLTTRYQFDPLINIFRLDSSEYVGASPIPNPGPLPWLYMISECNEGAVDQMARVRRERSTEVDAYVFIKETLKEIGWDIRNPSRFPTGCVYTQNECLEHTEIHAAFGMDRPENIVKISDSLFWIIEAKKDQRQLAPKQA